MVRLCGKCFGYGLLVVVLIARDRSTWERICVIVLPIFIRNRITLLEMECPFLTSYQYHCDLSVCS